MREPLTIEQDGLLLHGTAHRGGAECETGVLFLNSGSLPRSSRGDLYAQMADALGEKGFPCFRVDLPGLGDSQGDAPQEYVGFYKLVQEGEYADCVIKLARELRRRYGLSGLVLLGICGGAQTSVFAAAREQSAGVAGLALLDMPFFLYQDSKPRVDKRTSRALGNRIILSVLTIKARMRDWVLSQKWEPTATAIHNRLKRLTRRTKSGSLPTNTNHALIQDLCSLLNRGVPALLVTAHPPIPEPPSYDYVGHLAGRAAGGLKHVKIHGTTHSFVENEGAVAVLEAVSSWLGESVRAT